MLYYGDNPEVLRDQNGDETVPLVPYLDQNNGAYRSLVAENAASREGASRYRHQPGPLENRPS